MTGPVFTENGYQACHFYERRYCRTAIIARATSKSLARAGVNLWLAVNRSQLCSVGFSWKQWSSGGWGHTSSKSLSRYSQAPSRFSHHSINHTAPLLHQITA